MKVLIDMNLSPLWGEALRDVGHEPVHWSDIGAHGAPDSELLLWARAHRHVVPTNDLDFTAILAATQGEAPSVVQLRAHDLLPDTLGSVVIGALDQFAVDLAAGALVSIDPSRARVRKLPIQ